MMRILNSKDIHCSHCGRYLYSVREVVDEDTWRSRFIKEHDFEDYVYVDLDDSYYCDRCYQIVYPRRVV